MMFTSTFEPFGEFFEFCLSVWTTEGRWVRVTKHCELQRERSLRPDAVSLQKKESKQSIKLATFGSGLVGGNVTLFFTSKL